MPNLYNLMEKLNASILRQQLQEFVCALTYHSVISFSIYWGVKHFTAVISILYMNSRRECTSEGDKIHSAALNAGDGCTSARDQQQGV